MLPEISIIYSPPYEWNYFFAAKKRWSTKLLSQGYKYQTRLRKRWTRDEKKVLRTISKVTGLKWKERTIRCYIVAHSLPISEPLTVPMLKNLDASVEAMIHELVHQIFIQNNTFGVGPEYAKKYRRENWNTIIHLPVQAVVKIVLEKTYGDDAGRYIKYEQWWRDYPKSPLAPEYRRAWEIMNKEGAQRIIDAISKAKFTSPPRI